jgi:RNA polymerase sigma-70 factor (ECF subfamily)
MSRPSAPAVRSQRSHPELSRPHRPQVNGSVPDADLETLPVSSPAQPAVAALPCAEQIFRDHAPRIYSLARRLLSNEADVEDVVGEVLLQVVRRLHTFRGQSELTTWLHRVTVNCALLHRRKNAPRLARQFQASVEQVLELANPPANTKQDRPECRVIAGETQRLIEQAINQLPEMYRDPFVLSDIEELPNAEIGKILGLSLAAVKSRLHRARLLLRDALAPYFQEGHFE